MLAKEKITKIVEKWYLLEPLYFAVWTLHKVEVSVHLKTIKVNNGSIYYNPTFIDNLTVKELNEVLAFEAMRIILKHPYRRKKDISQISYQASNITVQEYLKTTSLGFQSAEDYFGHYEYNKKHFEFYYHKIIEQELDKLNNPNSQDSQDNENNENGANEEIEDTNDNSNSSSNSEDNSETENNENDTQNNSDAENDSNDPNDTQNNSDAENDSNNENDTQNNSDAENDSNATNDTQNNSDTENNSNNRGNDVENKSDNPKNQDNSNNNGKKSPENTSPPKNDLSEYTDKNQTGFENANDWDKSEYEEELINDKIKEVQISNSWGSITGNIQEQILATLKPKVNYRTILKSFRASILSNSRRLTRIKPSRRYGFLYMGSRRDFTTKLLFAVDISGSVSSKALKNAFSILNRFFKYGIEEISTIGFDSEIKGELLTLKKAKKEINIYGRGGTDFNAVIDYININRDYDGVIIFTDGYAPPPAKPKNRKTKILWLFDNEKNHDACKDALSKFGKVAFVKES